jgi:hypothetical protein
MGEVADGLDIRRGLYSMHGCGGYGRVMCRKTSNRCMTERKSTESCVEKPLIDA